MSFENLINPPIRKDCDFFKWQFFGTGGLENFASLLRGERKMEKKNSMMKEKCPECREDIDVAEDGSFHCHNCGNVGMLEQ